MKELIPLAAVVLSMLIPIVAIIGAILEKMNRKNRDKEIRELLIVNKTDLETSKLLLEEFEHKGNKFTALRWGLVLVGCGIGLFINCLAGMSTGVYFWLIIASGIGIGLLISFVIEMRMSKQETKSEE